MQSSANIIHGTSIGSGDEEQRINHYLSDLVFRDSILCATLEREKLEEWRPRPNEMAFDLVGGTTGRSMLITWLFSESERTFIRTETVFLAVNYFERMISLKRVDLGSVQELAAVCLQLAAKMNETSCDSLDMPSMNGWTANPHLEMFTLLSLEWKLFVPTPYVFLTIYSDKVWLPELSLMRALTYLKQLLLFVECNNFYPSTLALVSILLLEAEEMLPQDCKTQILRCIRDERISSLDVNNAFRTFRDRCLLSEPRSDEDEACDSGNVIATGQSSTTAYATSAESAISSQEWEAMIASHSSDLGTEPSSMMLRPSTGTIV